MPKHSDPRPESRSFRYRFPLELTPDESQLLEHAARQHPSKRAAILAGLAALAERDQSAARETALTAEREQLEAELTAVRERAAGLEADLLAAKRNAAEAKGTRRRERDTREQAQRRADRLERVLADEQERVAALETELDQLEADLVDWLRCQRCSSWVGRGEWARARDGQHEAIYHEPCGYHGDGILGTSVLALRN